MSLLHRALAGPLVVDVDPETAGWGHTGLQVRRLAPGQPLALRTDDSELFVLPLSGSVRVTAEGKEFELQGRDSVFSRVADFCYVGRDSVMTLVSEAGAEVALPSSRCEVALPPAYGAAEDVPVEVRGAGPATRQVVNFGVPGVWDHADKLICCELLTPEGNWSSYPPHKHDASDPCRVVNEEIYYYRIQGEAGFGYHRTYTGPEHAVAGLRALALDHVEQVGERLRDRPQRALDAAEEVETGGGKALEVGAVFVGHPEQLADRQRGDRQREALHEVHLALLGGDLRHLIELTRDDRVDPRCEAA